MSGLTANPLTFDLEYELTLTANAMRDTFTVTVFINLNDEEYEGLTVELNGSMLMGETAKGVYTLGGVVAGEYSVHVGGVDTGITVDVGDSEDNEATLNYYTLTLTKGTGISSVSGNGKYLAGTEVDISAIVSTGYSWVKWIDETEEEFGDIFTQNAKITTPGYPLELTATAEPDTYDITVDGTNVNRTTFKDVVEHDTVDYSFTIWTLPLGRSAITEVTFLSMNGEELTLNGDGPDGWSYTPGTVDDPKVRIIINGPINGHIEVVVETKIIFTISGVVKDTDGNVFDNTEIEYEINGVKGYITTDENGRYSVKVLQGSSFEATLSADGYVLSSSPSFDPVSGTVTDANIILDKKYTATVEATVDGEAEDGLEISISKDGENFFLLVGTGDGSYAVDVVRGVYSIYVDGTDTGRKVTVTDSGGNATLDWWTLTVEKGDGISSVTGSGVYLSGETVTDISAAADTGYTFKEWTADPDTFEEVPAGASGSITMPAYALELTATASVSVYEMSVIGLKIVEDSIPVEHFQEGAEMEIKTEHGYLLKGIASVHMNGIKLEETDYELDLETCTIKIFGPVDGDIVIVAITEPVKYSVEVSGVNVKGKKDDFAPHDAVDFTFFVGAGPTIIISEIYTVYMNGDLLGDDEWEFTPGDADDTKSEVIIKGPVNGNIVIEVGTTTVCTVTGIVKDVDGRPFPNTTVLYKIDNGELRYVTTDSDGSYSVKMISGSSFEASVTVPGYTVIQSPFFESVLNSMNGNIILTETFVDVPSYIISGKVVDTEGNVFPGAVIEYKIDDGEPDITYADAEGKYWISVPAGSNFEATVTRSGYTTTPLSFDDVDENISDADIVLERIMYVISGTVTKDELPLENALVFYSIYGTPGSVYADENGHYTISVPEGASFSATVTLSGFKVTSSPSYDDVTDNIDDAHIVLEASVVTVSGIVTIDGTPTGGFRMEYTVNGDKYQIEVEDDGSYSVTIPEGASFSATVTMAGHKVTSSPSYPSVTSDIDDAHITLVTLNYKVGGTVTLSGTEDPLDNVTVNYVANGKTGSVMTNSEGYYEISDVPWNSVFAITSLYKAGHSEVIPLPVSFIVTDNRMNVNMSMTVNIYEVSGTVYDDSDTGIKEVTINYTIDGTHGSTLTDEEGKYSVSVRSGAAFIVLSIYKTGYSASSALPSVIVNDNKENVDMTMTINVYTISGTVFDEDNNGISATVYYTINEISGSTTTDADGSYTIPADVPAGALFSATAEADGYTIVSSVAPFIVNGNKDDADIHMEMIVAVTYKVSGTVYDEDSNGIPFAVVNFTINGVPDSVDTDGSGYYEVEVPEGATFSATATAENYTLVSSVTPFDVDDNTDDAHIFMKLCEADVYEVSGHVLDENDAAMSGVVINYTIDDVPGWTVSDMDGSYTINVQEGSELKITSLVKAHYTVSEIPDPFFVNANTPNVDMFMTLNVYTVSGHILDENDAAMSGVVINYTIDDVPGWTVTNASGSYTIYVSEGLELEITSLAKAHYTEVLPLPLFTVNANTPNVDMIMTLNVYTVSGKVTDSDDDTGLEGVTISYTINGVLGSVTTEEDGTYSVKVTAGRGFVVTGINKTGYSKDAIPSPFIVNANTPDVNMTMTENVHTVSGKVTINGTDTGLEGVTISYTINGVSDSTTTGAGGIYEVPNVPSGALFEVFDLSYPNYVKDLPLPLPIIVLSDENDRNMTMTEVIGSYTISGTVKDADGNEMDGIDVYYSVNGIPQGSVTTDDGHYEITDIPKGVSFTSSVTIPGYEMISSPSYAFVNDDITDAHIVVEMITYTVSGIVKDTNDEPFKGVTVFYVINGVSDSTEADEEGRYIIGGIPANADFSAFAVMTGYDLIDSPDLMPISGSEMNADIVLKAIEFVISGTIYDGDNEPILGSVTIYYTINGGAPGTVTSDPETGVYEITVRSGGKLLVTGLYKVGYTEVLPFPPELTVLASDDTVDLYMDEETYTISGTVKNSVTGETIEDVKITYTIGGTLYTMTSADGTYSITNIPANAAFWMNAEKDGFVQSSAPAFKFVTSSAADADTAMIPTYKATVTMIAGKGTFEYSLDKGKSWHPMTEIPGNKFAVPVNIQHGTALWIRAIPAAEGDTIEWTFGMLKSLDDEYRHNITGNFDVSAAFIHHEDPSSFPLWIIAAVLSAGAAGGSIFFLFFWLRRSKIVGVLTYNGNAVEGAMITYQIKKDGKLIDGEPTRTNKDGKYEIIMRRGSDVVITAAAFENYDVLRMFLEKNEMMDIDMTSAKLPIPLRTAKRITELDIEMTEIGKD